MLYRARISTIKANRTRQILAVSLLAIMTSACSTDVKRFAYVTSEPGASTASIPERSRVSSAPVERVHSQRLAPVADYNTAPPPVTPSGGARTITVEQGDTLNDISRRHNVSVAEIAAANNLRYPYDVQVGQRLNVPAPGAPRTAWNRPASSSTSIAKGKPGPGPRNPAFASRRSSASGVHVVKSGETLYGISHQYGMKPAELARLNHLDGTSVIKVGQKLRLSGKTVAAKKPARAVRKTTRTAANVPVPRKRPVVLASQKSKQMARAAASPRKTVKTARAAKPATRTKITRVASRSTQTMSGGNMFRWPVKGRVISQFGRKANGARNDGVNFAVPEGASIKSAGHGVVAYAGNELKGYGNLILIRHSDDWVTAYAHNSKLLVKRGQKVRRGEIIAKAGQTGSVDRPQLHFEVRKGAQAVNPMKYMGNSV
ncbi:MAG: peptidoglycan-binding LysM [Hyphomicrobiales bacterium]|nr:MAG: peptidoglycan-binding LysM [Hyphomicrobiales bacterium]